MAAGNRHLGYKDALNQIEVDSPGAKQAFYFASSTGGRPCSGPRPWQIRPACGPACPACLLPARFAAPFARSSFGPEAAGEPDLLHRRPGPARRRQGPEVSGDPGRGWRVSHSRRVRPTRRAAGRPEGVIVRSTTGARYTAVRPTLAEFVLKMPSRGPSHLSQGPRCHLDAGRSPPRSPGARGRGRLRRPVDGHAASRGRRGRLRATSGLRAQGRSQRQELLWPRGVGALLAPSCATCTTGSKSVTWTGSPRPPGTVCGSSTPRTSCNPGGILLAYLPTINAQTAHLRGSPTRSRRHGRDRGSAASGMAHRRGVGTADHRMVAHTGFLTHAPARRLRRVVDLLDLVVVVVAVMAVAGGYRLGFLARVVSAGPGRRTGGGRSPPPRGHRPRPGHRPYGAAHGCHLGPARRSVPRPGSRPGGRCPSAHRHPGRPLRTVDRMVGAVGLVGVLAAVWPCCRPSPVFPAGRPAKPQLGAGSGLPTPRFRAARHPAGPPAPGWQQHVPGGVQRGFQPAIDD